MQLLSKTVCIERGFVKLSTVKKIQYLSKHKMTPSFTAIFSKIHTQNVLWLCVQL